MTEKLTIPELQQLKSWGGESSASETPVAQVGALVQRLVEEVLELRQPPKAGARRIVGWAAINKEATVQPLLQPKAEGERPVPNDGEAATRRAAELERQLAEARRAGKVLVEALQSASASAGWSLDRRRIDAALAEGRKLGWLP